MNYAEFEYRSQAIDELWVSVCRTCGASVHHEDQDRHLQWHASTTVHVGADSDVHDRGTTVERASRPRP